MPKTPYKSTTHGPLRPEGVPLGTDRPFFYGQAERQ